MNDMVSTQAAEVQVPGGTTPSFAIPAGAAVLPGTSKPEDKPKPKRQNYPFVHHKKTPYLARRGKPSPNTKKDGQAGEPMPFGSWYVYKTIDGVDYRFSLETEVYEEAKAKYDHWLENLNIITPTEGSLSSLLPEILQRRKATCKGKRSMVPIMNAANRLQRGCPFMKVGWKDLNNSMIFSEWNEFVNSGCQTQDDGSTSCHDYSLNTLKTDYGLLRYAMRMAVKKHSIPTDHDLLDNVAIDDADNSCPRCVSELSRDMFDKIRWHIYNGHGTRHPHTPIVFDVYWMSGGRKSSVANIHTEDINFATGWLFFRVAKGRPEGYNVPMSIDLQLLLKEHVEKYHKSPGERIFEVSEINHSIATACAEAGWQHMHAHDLRHLFACHALERTKNIGQVAKWLGHTDGGILAAKVYATTRDEESQRNMSQNMIFISRAWSPEGLTLMRTRIEQRLSDIAVQVGASPTQADIENLLLGLKSLIENPLSATEMEAMRVLASGSVIPIGVKNVVVNRMVEWIRLNPAIRTQFVMDLLKGKFPDSTPAMCRRAMLLTKCIRIQANKDANAELHARMEAYLHTHPDRSVAWLLYDFPDATICQINRAILAVYGSVTRGQIDKGASGDHSCPATISGLLKERSKKQAVAAMAKLMATELPS
jgi:hypothetical protein